ncbi:hypothetical protein [Porphyromonas pogonae]|uniref:hypothetical protein n=1 Tax=Porphyromonas pogonae TaxID=867595 RepID=UPI002E78D4C5|nr:hypothetical protein [Porphyromonas pogonae]
MNPTLYIILVVLVVIIVLVAIQTLYMQARKWLSYKELNSPKNKLWLKLIYYLLISIVAVLLFTLLRGM